VRANRIGAFLEGTIEIGDNFQDARQPHSATTKGQTFRVSAYILPHPRLSSQVAATPQPGRPKNERRMKMKTTKTKSTSVRDELLREVEASLQAGRIDADQAEMMRQIIRDNDSNCNRDTLRYFERLHTLHKYIDFHGLGFTIHEITYHYRLPDSQKRKLIAALEEALTIVKIDLRAGISMNVSPQNPNSIPASNSSSSCPALCSFLTKNPRYP
jgi:hypothetical protein